MTDELGSPRGRVRPARKGTPPPAEFFVAPRPAAGSRVFRLTLGPLRIDLEALDDARAGELLHRFGPFGSLAKDVDVAALRIRVGLEDRDYFIDPIEGPEFNPVFIAADGDTIRYLGYKVAARFDAGRGDGVLFLARGGFEPDDRALENFIRAAVAWRAARAGGALVHAASAVRRGRGYLFYGASGAGKSTLAAATQRATIVSDDLSLVLPAPDRALCLVGSPFRGTYEAGPPVVGTFPLAAAFRLIQAMQAEVRDVPRVRALSELVANLPFVADSFAGHPELFEGIERAFAAVPLRHLHFRPDDTYWDAVDAAGL